MPKQFTWQGPISAKMYAFVLVTGFSPISTLLENSKQIELS